MKISEASDYAVLETGPWLFYYGYEYWDMLGNKPDEWLPDPWGFIAKKNGEIVTNFQYEPEGRGTSYDLLACIGMMIEKKYA